MSLPLLHGSTEGSFLTAWVLDPLLVPLLVTAALTYILGLRAAKARRRPPISSWRIASFFAGLAAIAVALIGPLDVWNDELLFIHMLQHLVLMIVAAPLLLLGRPVQVALQALAPSQSSVLVGTLFRSSRARDFATFITHPLTVFMLFNLNMSLWHLPALYMRALESDLVHEIEHFTFLSTALLFWWILIDPVPRHHRAPLHWQFGLYFGTCMVGGLVAAALTVANRVIYPYYLHAVNPWGITPMTDQKLGGGIMWISGAVYFILMFVLLYRMANAGATGAPRQPVPATPVTRPDHSGI